MTYQDAMLNILNNHTIDPIMFSAETEDHNSYLVMYDRIEAAIPTMLKSADTIKLLPLMVYGWMPTILAKSAWDDSIPEILNRKNGNITESEMKILRSFMNDSFIGLSKLLHFTDPDHWAIWDSNVFAALEVTLSDTSPENLKKYCLDNYAKVDCQIHFESYQQAIRSVSEEVGVSLRDIEKRLFYYGRYLKKIAKNK